MIFFIEGVVKPPQAPRRALKIIKTQSSKKESFLMRVLIISMGAIFWGIRSNHNLNHEIELEIVINQPCKGATPIFNLKAVHNKQ